MGTLGCRVYNARNIEGYPIWDPNFGKYPVGGRKFRVERFTLHISNNNPAQIAINRGKTRSSTHSTLHSRGASCGCSFPQGNSRIEVPFT